MRPIDAGEREIGCDLDAGHGYQPDAGIRHFSGEDLADFFANLLGDAFDTMREGHNGLVAQVGLVSLVNGSGKSSRYPVPDSPDQPDLNGTATRSIVNTSMTSPTLTSL